MRSMYLASIVSGFTPSIRLFRYVIILFSTILFLSYTNAKADDSFILNKKPLLPNAVHLPTITSDDSEWKNIQAGLKDKGLYSGKIDGLPFELTRKALIDYHEDLWGQYRVEYEYACWQAKKNSSLITANKRTQSYEGDIARGKITLRLIDETSNVLAECDYVRGKNQSIDPYDTLSSIRVSLSPPHKYVFHYDKDGNITQEGLMDTTYGDPDGTMVLLKSYYQEPEGVRVIYKGVPYESNGLLIFWHSSMQAISPSLSVKGDH